MAIRAPLASLHRHLAALIHRFMPQLPTEVEGLFVFQPLPFNEFVRKWRDSLSSEDASSCHLECIDICKASREKPQHEFLLLHFTHPTHPTARATVIVDRTVKDARPLPLISPSSRSDTPTPANDMVQIIPQDFKPSKDKFLTNRFGKYEKLCTLTYPLHDTSSPSVVQLSNLIHVVSNYRPNYHLYEHNCYWFADVIFEGCKVLFPGGQEECLNHNDRGRFIIKLPTIETDILPVISKEYNVEWNKFVQRPRKDQEAQAWKREAEEQRRGREEVERNLRESEKRREELERRYRELQAKVQGTGSQSS